MRNSDLIRLASKNLKGKWAILPVIGNAASKCVNLHANQTGSVKTGSFYTSTSHYSGYNSMSSTNKMVLKYQFYKGKWQTIATRVVNAQQYVNCATITTDPPGSFRVKISPLGGVAGAEGIGCVFDN